MHLENLNSLRLTYFHQFRDARRIESGAQKNPRRSGSGPAVIWDDMVGFLYQTPLFLIRPSTELMEHGQQRNHRPEVLIIGKSFNKKSQIVKSSVYNTGYKFLR